MRCPGFRCPVFISISAEPYSRSYFSPTNGGGSFPAFLISTKGTSSATAIATSVLYLVPGVPLINGVIDIVEGHVLIGFSRLTEAALLIMCIAIGLSFTLIMVKNGLI